MDETQKYPSITHFALKIRDADATEAFVKANNIEITRRREFRGTKTIFIRDPERNVLELVDPRPSVAKLISGSILDQNKRKETT